MEEKVKIKRKQERKKIRKEGQRKGYSRKKEGERGRKGRNK
jgi:hypothetical protein